MEMPIIYCHTLFSLHLSLSLCLSSISLSPHSPLRFNCLFISSYLPYFAFTCCLYSSVAWFHLSMDFHNSLPLASSFFHSLQYIHISHSETVHWNELSASVRHSQWCGRRAASLSLCLSVSVFVSLSPCGKKDCLSFWLLSSRCSGELNNANNTRQTDPWVKRQAYGETGRHKDRYM